MGERASDFAGDLCINDPDSDLYDDWGDKSGCPCGGCDRCFYGRDALARKAQAIIDPLRITVEALTALVDSLKQAAPTTEDLPGQLTLDDVIGKDEA